MIVSKGSTRVKPAIKMPTKWAKLQVLGASSVIVRFWGTGVERGRSGAREDVEDVRDEGGSTESGNKPGESITVLEKRNQVLLKGMEGTTVCDLIQRVEVPRVEGVSLGAASEVEHFKQKNRTTLRRWGQCSFRPECGGEGLSVIALSGAMQEGTSSHIDPRILQGSYAWG